VILGVGIVPIRKKRSAYAHGQITRARLDRPRSAWNAVHDHL